MDSKIKFFIRIVIFAVIYIFLGFLKNKILQSAIPQTLIGMPGLYAVRSYLIKYIIANIVLALLLIVLSFYIIFIKIARDIESDEGYSSVQSRKMVYTLLVFFSLVIGLTSFSGYNELDKQCEILETSRSSFFKSIILLNKVNEDIKDEIYVSGFTVNPSVSKEEYRYSSGRSFFHKSQYCFDDGNDKLLSQVTLKDAYIMHILFSATEEVKYQKYLESGFIRSVMTIDDFTKLEDGLKKSKEHYEKILE